MIGTNKLSIAKCFGITGGEI